MSDTPLGARLREARRTARMSQTDVERASGIPKTMLSRYENGHVSPSLDSLHRIAAALGIADGSLIDDRELMPYVLYRELAARGVTIVSQEQAIHVAGIVADALRQTGSA
jgi:transcriptional regulator with XRE-family HTH domain